MGLQNLKNRFKKRNKDIIEGEHKNKFFKGKKSQIWL